MSTIILKLECGWNSAELSKPNLSGRWSSLVMEWLRDVSGLWQRGSAVVQKLGDYLKTFLWRVIKRSLIHLAKPDNTDEYPVHFLSGDVETEDSIEEHRIQWKSTYLTENSWPPSWVSFQAGASHFETG